MTFVSIGIIVGIVVGLTGAGGALVSIPLFMLLTGATLKESTVLSLIAVIFGAIVNLRGKLVHVDKKIVLPLVLSGIASNYLSLPFKALTPNGPIGFLLSCIALYSLWSVWGTPRMLIADKKKQTTLKAVVTGIILGVLTTLTGLGGGVLLVPILIKVFGKDYEKALPNSLLSIVLISTTALFLQLKANAGPTAIDLLSLAIGTLVASSLLNFTTTRIAADRVELLRKVTFTCVTVYAIGSIIWSLT